MNGRQLLVPFDESSTCDQKRLDVTEYSIHTMQLCDLLLHEHESHGQGDRDLVLERHSDGESGGKAALLHSLQQQGGIDASQVSLRQDKKASQQLQVSLILPDDAQRRESMSISNSRRKQGSVESQGEAHFLLHAHAA